MKDKLYSVKVSKIDNGYTVHAVFLSKNSHQYIQDYRDVAAVVENLLRLGEEYEFKATNSFVRNVTDNELSSNTESN